MITYLLTPWSTVFLEKLTVFQLVKKFPAFYGTRKFITAFTRPGHLSLFLASTINSEPPHSTSWRSILILSSHLRLDLPSGLFPQGSPPKPCIRLFSPLHVILQEKMKVFWDVISCKSLNVCGRFGGIAPFRNAVNTLKVSCLQHRSGNRKSQYHRCGCQ